MAELNDPPNQQLIINKTSAKNRQARPSPYVDQRLTLENVDSTPAAPLDVVGESGPTTQGDIRPFYANDKKTNLQNIAAKTQNIGVEPPPAAPNKWVITKDAQNISRARDPYRNHGLAPYLDNL